MCIRDRYCTIKFRTASKAAVKTKQIAESLWIKEEIRQLYSKKTKLNTKLYNSYLHMMNTIHPALIPKVLQYIDCLLYTSRCV